MTEGIRSGTIQLFVSFKKGQQGQEVTKITIAKWIKNCIKMAYQLLNLPLPSIEIDNELQDTVKAHSTRKQSASWADLNKISLQDICTHAGWVSSDTFVKHYKLSLRSPVSARRAGVVFESACAAIQER